MPAPTQYSSPSLVCTSCGQETVRPDRVKPGTGWLTATLLCCFVVPGVVYWIWRTAMKEDRCPLCHRATLIPSVSPIGRAILQSPWQNVQNMSLGTPDVRFDRLEEAIDAMAIEVERVSESQRYATRLLHERSSSPQAPPDARVKTPT